MPVEDALEILLEETSSGYWDAAIVDEFVAMIHEEGLEAVFQRHLTMAHRVREWATERGYGLQGPGIVHRSPTLSALKVPPGTEPERLRARARESGIQIAVGLGAYQPTCQQFLLGDALSHGRSR